MLVLLRMTVDARASRAISSGDIHRPSGGLLQDRFYFAVATCPQNIGQMNARRLRSCLGYVDPCAHRAELHPAAFLLSGRTYQTANLASNLEPKVGGLLLMFISARLWAARAHRPIDWSRGKASAADNAREATSENRGLQRWTPRAASNSWKVHHWRFAGLRGGLPFRAGL